MNGQFNNKRSEIVLDQFRSEDAAGVAECFKKVYGEDYPIKIFYEPDELIEANKTGQYLPLSHGHSMVVLLLLEVSFVRLLIFVFTRQERVWC